MLAVFAASASDGIVVFRESFDTASTGNPDLYDTQWGVSAVQDGVLKLVYPSGQYLPPSGIECTLPAVPEEPGERQLEFQFSGGGSEMSNSLFVAYALGPGQGLSLPPLVSVSSPNTRTGYIVRFIRHGDGTNEIKFYRNDGGWVKELQNAWIQSNPVTTLRRLLIRHFSTGEHNITVTFDTGVLYERVFALEDESYPPGNAAHGIQISAKGHAALHTAVAIAVDSWAAKDLPAGKRRMGKKEKVKRVSKKSGGKLDPAGEIVRANVEYDAKNFTAARDICLDVLSKDSDFIDAIDLLGRIETALGNFSDAFAHLRRSLDLRKKEYGADNLKVAECLVQLGKMYEQKGAAEAETCFLEAMSIRRNALGPEHPDVAVDLDQLGSFYTSIGRWPEAESCLKEAVGIFEKTAGDELRLARSLSHLGWLYFHHQRRDTEAEPVYRRAVPMYEKILPPEDLELAYQLHVLAELLRVLKQTAEAESLYKRVLAIREKSLGPDHPDVAKSVHKLAELYRMKGRLTEAETFYKRELAIREKSLGPDHPEVAGSLNNLGNLYTDMGRFAKAEPLYKRSADICERTLGPDHTFLAKILENLALLYKRMDRLDESNAALRRAKDIWQKKQ